MSREEKRIWQDQMAISYAVSEVSERLLAEIGADWASRYFLLVDGGAAKEIAHFVCKEGFEAEYRLHTALETRDKLANLELITRTSFSFEEASAEGLKASEYSAEREAWMNAMFSYFLENHDP